jgi:hypothetical protein
MLSRALLAPYADSGTMLFTVVRLPLVAAMYTNSQELKQHKKRYNGFEERERPAGKVFKTNTWASATRTLPFRTAAHSMQRHLR